MPEAPLGLPFLNPIFSDHMVLQREMPNTFWGWTDPGATVRVTIDGNSATGVADSGGKWSVQIDPPAVGGPYSLTVEGPKKLELNDVMVGDVWLCGGQSNMEQGLTMCADADSEVAAAGHPNIRLAMIPRDTQFEPRQSIPASWSRCNPESVTKGGWGGFSGVAYYFGRKLQEELGVPIGLIENCWGGTPAEAWISRPRLEGFGGFGPALAAVDAARAAGHRDYIDAMDAWFVAVDPGSGSEGWHAECFDHSDWPTCAVPATFEELGLPDHGGAVWFRCTVSLADDPGEGAILSLGPISDTDSTWVNGVLVGATAEFGAARRYQIPAGVLRQGSNTIAVRVLDTGGIGGFQWPSELLGIELADGASIPLPAGAWHFRPGANIWAEPTMQPPVDLVQYTPTVLHNGMLNPIAGVAIKGAIWYQGETNVPRATQYRTLLPTMIEDWRAAWDQGDFPFFIVQLANFGVRGAEPGDSDWAELREAQMIASKSAPNAGIVTAVDVGEADDIHPKDKRSVGDRLALLALHQVYGAGGAYTGPTYRDFSVFDGAARVAFDHTDGGLQAKRGALDGFMIAGEDRRFHWADARIEGDSVTVSSPDVPNPVAVRYGWANDPVLSLYNAAGLPAFPFRTDDWPGVTS